MGACDSISKNNNKVISKVFIPNQNSENNEKIKEYYNLRNNINNIELNQNKNFNGNNNLNELIEKKDDNKQKEVEIHNNDNLNISSEQSEKVIKQSKFYICKVINKPKYGTGFLCKIPFPDKSNYLPVLMTNHHVINEEELLNEKKLTIKFENDLNEKIIKITSERKIFSLKNDIYDITIIEIFPEEDKIYHFLEIESTINKEDKNYIYILQFPGMGENSISYGKICDIKGCEIFYNASTLKGSSGGPILLLKNYKLIGIHIAYAPKCNLNNGMELTEPIKKFNSKYQKNKIKKNKYINCIICKYELKNEEEFDLLHDYTNQTLNMDNQLKQLYNEGKKKKNILKENINIYIDDKLINFNFRYKTNKKIINVKFIFKEILNDLSFLFYKCKYLKLIDLSPYNAINVNNMSYMFSGCNNLESIDFFSFNTNNVINMSNMFSECESLQSLDLSSFNTSKVINMEKMFFECSSIKKLDLTSFDTINVINMSKMFANCYSLKFLYLSIFKTNNVINMERMFSRCSSIKSLNLSSFNTIKVVNMEGMFEYCSTLESLNVKSFNTINVKNMRMMFIGCLIAKSFDLSSFNTINVTDMQNMFGGDCLLESLDLSLFNTINVTNIFGIFGSCINLKNVKCKDEQILKQKDLKLFSLK